MMASSTSWQQSAKQGVSFPTSSTKILTIKNTMKIIKKNTPVKQALKDRFAVGDVIGWTTTFFDGRGTEYHRHTGTVVQVNKVTVDVELANGDIARLDEWDLATVDPRTTARFAV